MSNGIQPSPDKPKLEPCPFCGTQPIYDRKAGSYGYYPSKVRVKCNGCNARQEWYDCESWTQRKGHFSVMKQAFIAAAKAWNQRVTSNG